MLSLPLVSTRSVERVLTRRDWLRLGGLGSLGLLLAAPGSLSQAVARSTAPSAAKSSGFGRAKSVLLLYTGGGQSQLETWDPKPDAPAEIRGAFNATRSSVPGTLLCEHLSRVARLAHRYTIIRSVSHDDLDHGSATYLALTGQFHLQKSGNPLPQLTDLPTYGAILKRLRPTDRFPYTAAHLNGPLQVPQEPAPGQFAGLLGRSQEPLHLGDVTEGAAVLRSLEPQPELSGARLTARHSLLQAFERETGSLQRERPVLDMNTLYRQAYDLLDAPRCRQAFDLSQEPETVRDRYGRHRSGQACLLARRLVEAGVPWVTVLWNHNIRGQDKEPHDTDLYGWDTHNDIFEALKDHLLPRFDLSFSTLLEDMEERGLLDQTLVVCMGEFGRSPRVALERGFAGSTPGRKHWAAVYSIVMAGAGVAPGGVVGASDRQAAYPQSSPFGPWDVAATMFHALGIDPAGHYQDLSGRPYPITVGKPILELYRG